MSDTTYFNMAEADDVLREEELTGLASRSIVPKNRKCPSESRFFEDWRFDAENFLSVVLSEYGEELQIAISTPLTEGEDLGMVTQDQD